MKRMPEAKSVANATLGVDIGKSTFHRVGLDKRGAIALRERLSRAQVEVRLANVVPCLDMEACAGAHHLGNGRPDRAKELDGRQIPAIRR